MVRGPRLSTAVLGSSSARLRGPSEALLNRKLSISFDAHAPATANASRVNTTCSRWHREVESTLPHRHHGLSLERHGRVTPLSRKAHWPATRRLGLCWAAGTSRPLHRHPRSVRRVAGVGYVAVGAWALDSGATRSAPSDSAPTPSTEHAAGARRPVARGRSEAKRGAFARAFWLRCAVSRPVWFQLRLHRRGRRSPRRPWVGSDHARVPRPRSPRATGHRSGCLGGFGGTWGSSAPDLAARGWKCPYRRRDCRRLCGAIHQGNPPARIPRQIGKRREPGRPRRGPSVPGG